MDRTCETCRYWEWTHKPDYATKERGTCKRFPPQFINAVASPAFPNTDDDQWCGEHAQREDGSG